MIECVLWATSERQSGIWAWYHDEGRSGRGELPPGFRGYRENNVMAVAGSVHLHRGRDGIAFPRGRFVSRAARANGNNQQGWNESAHIGNLRYPLCADPTPNRCDLYGK